MPIYMKHGDVTGNVKQTAHEGWTQLQSLELEIDRHYTTSSGAAKNREGGQIRFSEVRTSKLAEDSSIDLLKMAIVGTEGKETTIDITTTSEGDVEQLILQIILKETLLPTMGKAGTGGAGAGRPDESVTLAFTDIQFNFFGQTQGGTAGDEPFRTGFNLATNSPR